MRKGIRLSAMLQAPRRIAGLLARVRAATDAAEAPEEVLWAVWSASRWREELERLVHRPGNAPPALLRRVDRQLDAVVALFEAAARFTDRLPAAGLAVFLKGLLDQEIPADPLSQRSFTADAVRLMTAHRSKGLEWEFVVVAGVQEGVWPDLRRRSTLLEADALTAADDEPSLFADDEAAMAARAGALVDERRLFYVAVTRARRRLLITAVSGGDDAELRPSRFLGELGVSVPLETETAPRLLSLSALVAELRCVAADEGTSPALRSAAVAELARLVPDVAAANPDRWWGLRSGPSVTFRCCRPIAGDFAEPGRHHPHLSASLVSGAARGVSSAASSSQGFGTLLHDVARHIVDAGVTDIRDLERRLDTHWPEIDWEAPWFAGRERAAAQSALNALLKWHRETAYEVVGAESISTSRWRSTREWPGCAGNRSAGTRC